MQPKTGRTLENNACSWNCCAPGKNKVIGGGESGYMYDCVCIVVMNNRIMIDLWSEPTVRNILSGTVTKKVNLIEISQYLPSLSLK
eukprot:m.161566 g.161566  ORF g.161566 m.161566 type:complete len:86 (-) comp31243_c0_seq1:190-447(-)